MVSCGDYLSGGVACSLRKGEYIVTLMNSVGYDAVTLGNHEYDFGMPRLMELLPGLNTPAVCVNLYDYQGTEPLMAPYVIRQYGSQRVAFVGVSTPESMDAEAYSFFDDKGRQLYDLHTKETYQMVQQAADKARKEGADYVMKQVLTPTDWLLRREALMRCSTDIPITPMPERISPIWMARRFLSVPQARSLLISANWSSRMARYIPRWCLLLRIPIRVRRWLLHWLM